MDGISGVRSNEAASIDDVSDSPAKQPAADNGPSTIVQHPGVQWAQEHDALEPHVDHGPVSRADLEAQMASNRKTLADFKSGIGSAVDNLAAKHGDPIGFFGNVSLKQAEFDPLIRAAQTPSGRAALNTMSTAAVETQVEGMVRKAWPKLDAEDVREVAGKVTQQLRDTAKYAAGYGMCAKAKDMMLSAADKVKDPKLADMLRRQAKELDSPAGARVFRAVADQNVAGLYAREAGIKPGSFAADQVAAAREQGKADNEQIEHMKLACSIAAVVATGGLGLSGMAAFGVSAMSSTVMNAPGIAEKVSAVDRAIAGEAAGTMEKGSVDRAKHNLKVAVAAAAGEVVIGGAAAHFGGHAVGHAVESGLEKELGAEAAQEAGHFAMHATHTAIESGAVLSANGFETDTSKEQP
jgi:hypothetical protein